MATTLEGKKGEKRLLSARLRFRPMPPPPRTREHPAAFLEEHGSFPEGPFTREMPREGHLAAALAIRLRGGIGNWPIRYVGAISGLNHQTIRNILNGTTWPDLRTIARLEVALKTRLWGTEHRKRPSYYKSFHPQ